MPFVVIDRDRCQRDHLCVAECPFGLFQKGGDGFPRTTDGAEDLCVDCGHCVAVCPTDAIVHKGLRPETLEPAATASPVRREDLARLVRNRRSVRWYRSQPVPRETIAGLLDMTRWAPTAKNGQPVHWLATDDPDDIRTMAGMTVDWMAARDQYPGIVRAWAAGRDMILRKAPVLVVAHAADQGYNPLIDCVIATTTLELAAASVGLGTCWAGFLMMAAVEYPPLREWLALPPGHRAFTALMMGYPRMTYLRVPPRKPSRLAWR